MERLNWIPLWSGHWKSLAHRQLVPDGGLHPTPDIPARILTLAVPVVAAVLAVVGVIFWGWRFDLAAAGFVIGVAALIVGGVLAAFGQLAGWRITIGQLDRDADEPLRAMLDETATHMLLAILESLAVAVLAVVGLILSPHGPWALLAVAPLAAAGAHVVWLFGLVVPRLYSAYAQVNDIPASMDGYAHTR